MIKKSTFQIVGEDEADVKLVKFLCISIIKALIGKVAGDIAEFQLQWYPRV